ncbi:ribonuclease E/G [Parasphingorhabdus halotolerans]|uniref:Ribonuclease n=1 Tax=Parasphingorhabdus halotolerans TaxID=2725558 RepID=A0A6H2DN29_9SPHN|nr:ribonuclease E/G [Parasphingorhabdus halotolerans]QJB69066.1 ribonuclease [Parasphingorhabdus halotolerans]
MADFQNGWLFEAGIGENRAMLIENGQCTRIFIERESDIARAGAVVDAKFNDQWVAGKSGIVVLESGEEALLQPLPKGLTEGSSMRVEVVREAMAERGGQMKRAKVKPAPDGAMLRSGPDLMAWMEASGQVLKQLHPHDTDHFAERGWHEAIEQAGSGRIEFEGGTLLFSLTPAMTVIDVDGPLPPFELAKRAAREVALALVRLDITGNVGVDFPTLEAKAERNAAAVIFDEHMTADCERTAINGFGFMQIVSRKTRASVPEIVQSDKVLTATLALLRQAERSGGSGSMDIKVHPAIAAKLAQRQHWLDKLAKRTGRAVSVEASGSIAINGGSVS